mmetsp:Transcript_95662/g.221809  ORF Transcript_95662/g.221809 Transcript_95662/m.221809 type:complete len:404 (+) Transcript_95662:126-1337(+)
MVVQAELKPAAMFRDLRLDLCRALWNQRFQGCNQVHGPPYEQFAVDGHESSCRPAVPHLRVLHSLRCTKEDGNAAQCIVVAHGLRTYGNIHGFQAEDRSLLDADCSQTFGRFTPQLMPSCACVLLAELQEPFSNESIPLRALAEETGEDGARFCELPRESSAHVAAGHVHSADMRQRVEPWIHLLLHHVLCPPPTLLKGYQVVFLDLWSHASFSVHPCNLLEMPTRRTPEASAVLQCPEAHVHQEEVSCRCGLLQMRQHLLQLFVLASQTLTGALPLLLALAGSQQGDEEEVGLARVSGNASAPSPQPVQPGKSHGARLRGEEGLRFTQALTKSHELAVHIKVHPVKVLERGFQVVDVHEGAARHSFSSAGCDRRQETQFCCRLLCCLVWLFGGGTDLVGLPW